LQLVKATARDNHILSSAIQGLASEAAASADAGGAVYMTGSQSSLEIDQGVFAGNWAAEGGAVAHVAAGGRLHVRGPVLFKQNFAMDMGGAVYAGKEVGVLLNQTSLANNSAAASDAAGGGFYCSQCSSVIVHMCNFSGNAAAYGGGAAVLQTAMPSEFVNCTFQDNKALPGQSLALKDVAALPSAGNTTLDDGAYLGGGGLYLSLSSNVTLKGSAFLNNAGTNGGERLADSYVPADLAADVGIQ
jgi:predicted outer membrane repeat protein